MSLYGLRPEPPPTVGASPDTITVAVATEVVTDTDTDTATDTVMVAVASEVAPMLSPVPTVADMDTDTDTVMPEVVTVMATASVITVDVVSVCTVVVGVTTGGRPVTAVVDGTSGSPFF